MVQLVLGDACHELRQALDDGDGCVFLCEQVELEFENIWMSSNEATGQLLQQIFFVHVLANEIESLFAELIETELCGEGIHRLCRALRFCVGVEIITCRTFSGT